MKESTMQKIIRDNRAAYDAVKAGDDLANHDDLFQALYNYFVFGGEMPYGVAKARFGCPYEWIMEQSFVWTY